MQNQYKKNSKDYSKYDAWVKIASENKKICSENKIREPIDSSLLIHKRCFYRILSTNFWKKNVSDGILEKIDKKSLSHLANFGH